VAGADADVVGVVADAGDPSNGQTGDRLLRRLELGESRTVISMESRLRPVVVKRQVLAPGSGGWPGSTGLPRTAAASASVISLHGSSSLGAPAAVVSVATGAA